MIYFHGTSHAALHLRAAAEKRGCNVLRRPEKADVIFVSEDTPTDDEGKRDLEPIRRLIEEVRHFDKPIVITSQVPPGFTRLMADAGYGRFFHQAETLRILDAEQRAMSPDYIAVGCRDGQMPLPAAYARYLARFPCPVLRMTWEEAEMTKIAVNMALAAQVDYANRMSKLCNRVGCSWPIVADAVRHDKRIGFYAYLAPGRWQDSKHLLRDYYTMTQLEKD